MNEIQDVKEALDPIGFEKRIKTDPRRLYGFLLCTDEHDDFRTFIQKSWRTLDKLSGQSCDIFTLEKWNDHPRERLDSSLYISIEGGTLGQPRITNGDRFGFADQEIAIDNGIRLPDRTQCFEVRDALFAEPRKVILPGFAVFHSVAAKRARYYSCGELTSKELSKLFQIVLTTIAEKYREGAGRTDIFKAFSRAELYRELKTHAVNAALKLSLADLMKVIGGSLHLIMPKSKDIPV